MSRTSRPHTKFVGLAVAGCWLFAACGLASAACVGDCDDNGVTSISEVQTCINVYLGTQAVGTCSNCDRDNSGDESIGELGDSVSSFLTDASSCPSVSVCGNAVIEPGEQCESDTHCAQGETCDASCQCNAGGAGLGLRVFSPSESSGFFTSALGIPGGGPSVANGYVGELRLQAGSVAADGTASLTVADDAILGWTVLDGSGVCVKVLAAGSSGSIDCDGGTPYDATMTQNSNGDGPEDSPVVETGLGAPAGAGAASFTAQVAVVNVDAPADPATDCPGANYAGLFVETPFTTTVVTGTITNAKPGSPGIVGGQLTLANMGSPFSCDSWTLENSQGVIVAPFLGFDQPKLSGGDTVNVLVADD